MRRRSTEPARAGEEPARAREKAEGRRVGRTSSRERAPLSCPRCESPLGNSGERLVCKGCEAEFPVHAEIPILLPGDSSSSIGRAQSAVARALDELRSKRAKLAASSWHPPHREETRRRLIAAADANERFLEALAARLPRSDRVVAAAPDTYEAMDQVMSYAARDWSFDAVNEERIAAIEAALPIRELDGGLAVVAGCGTGRIAHDLTALFDHVVGAEMSVPMAFVFPLLRERPREWRVVNLRNARTRASQIRQLKLEVRDGKPAWGRARPERLTMTVADATELPLASGSVSAFFSVYFTDVVPLRDLLAEVKRVLRPGGAFVHFGPLSYHFDDEEHMLSADDVREAFERAGFEVWHDATVTLRQTEGPNGRRDFIETRYHNWCFCARRSPSVSLTDDSRLEIVPGATAEVQSECTGSTLHVRSVRIKSPSGEELIGEADVIRVLELVDGKRACVAIERELGLRPGSTGASSVRFLLQHLLEMGYLQISRGRRTRK